MTTLRCTSRQLNLQSLVNGQSFRWRMKRMQDDGLVHFIGVARHRVWDVCRANDSEISFKVIARFAFDDFPSDSGESGDGELLREYFQLGVDLENLYDDWMRRDENFHTGLESSQLMRGLRILKQDPLEALIAFICSANNNIGRISRMVERFCELYGARVEFTTEDGRVEVFHDFPTLTQLQSSLARMENELRKSGFGYRAAHVSGAVRKLIEFEQLGCANANREVGSKSRWLSSLRNLPYEEAKRNLLLVPGIGPKVADCICLMGLGKQEAAPIDTHLFQLTTEMYATEHLPELLNKTRKGAMTKKIYEAIGDFYRKQFGPYAGWAQSVLFSARLKNLSKSSII